MENTSPLVEPVVRGFPWQPFIALVAILLVAIALLARQYTVDVSLPRYCADPGRALEYLEQVITERRPAGDGARRPYLIAAKLLFLVPRQPDEPVAVYLDRVAIHIEGVCR